MSSSSDNQERLRLAYADLLDDDATNGHSHSAALLQLAGDLDRLLEPYRSANPPAELSRSIDLLARDLASNATQQRAATRRWQFGPFGNRDGAGGGNSDLSASDDDPKRAEPHRRWSLGRELAGIAAVIVILALVSGALVAVFRGQNSEISTSPGSATSEPPLPAYAKNNPGAEAVYNQGLGKHIHLTYTNNGYTWTIHWVYADAVQMIAFYTVTAPTNVDIKTDRLSSGLIFTDSAGRQHGGASYGLVPLNRKRQADFLVWSSKSQSLASDGDTMKLRLDLGSLLLRSTLTPHKVPATVAHGKTITVTVPFDIGHEIPVGKQAKLDGASITLDHLRVVPSGIQAFFLYPKGSAIASGPIWGQLSDSQNGSLPCQPTSWSDSLNHFVFPCVPPASDAGNWTITLQPYDEGGVPTKDASKWLTFTFPANPGASVASIQPTPTLPSALKTDGRSIGDPNAPVKVVEWGDYQCSACSYFYRNSQKQFLNDYVATGKVYYTFRDYPLFGLQSENAAAAAWCASDQGKYWQFHDTMYGNQPPEGENGITDDFLRSVASSIGLNMQQFNSCYDSGKYKSKVQDDLAQAKDLKLNGTPTFFVNGSPVASDDYSSLKTAIDKALQGCSVQTSEICSPEVVGTPSTTSSAMAKAQSQAKFSDQDIKDSKAFDVDAAARRVIEAGKGTFMNESQKVGQTTVDVRWVYADLNQISVFFTFQDRANDSTGNRSVESLATCPGVLKTSAKDFYWSSYSAGPDTSREQGGLVGCLLNAYPTIHQGMPSPGSSVALVLSGNLGYRDHPEPKANFNITFSVPIQPALVSTPNQARMLAGRAVTLDQLVMTPTRIAFTVGGDGETSLQMQPSPKILIDGWGGTNSSNSPGVTIDPAEHQATFAVNCPPESYSNVGTWTITVFANDERGKTITNPADAAIFTVKLPQPSWVNAAVATPTP